MSLNTFALIIGIVLVVHICIYSIVSRICEAYENGKMIENSNSLNEIMSELEGK